MTLTPGDLLLAAIVSSMAAAIAYVRDPVRKAVIYILPLPFTAATLTLNLPVDSSHLVGAALLPAFVWTVRALYVKARLPIVLADALPLIAYGPVGWLLLRSLPAGDLLFWIALVLLGGVSILLDRFLPRPSEPGHRTSLPLYVKVPITVATVLVVMAVKSSLRGIVATFPYVGMFAVYEARHSLYTLGRRCFTLSALLAAMFAVMKLLQGRIGVPLALACGWAAYLALFLLLNRDVLPSKKPVAPAPPISPE
ncbi:MAG: hypothetical protein V2A58_04385 [Planctomycetota bacterium]